VVVSLSAILLMPVSNATTTLIARARLQTDGAMRLTTLLVLVFASSVTARRIYDSDKRDWNEKAGEPGITMRINQNGLNHIRKVVINSVNKALPTLTGLRAEKQFGDSAVLLHDLKVTGYKPPKYTLIKPSPNNTFVIGVEDVDIRCARFIESD